MLIETPRLRITDFTPEMALAVHLGSLDADMQRFLPDEVFPTVADAENALAALIACYEGDEGPFVHPCLLPDGTYIGYVQLVPLGDGTWEAGYHIVAEHTGNGYATEALQAFLPVMMARLHLTRVDALCVAENTASLRVLEKCGFHRVHAGVGTYQGQERNVVQYTFHLG